MNSALDRLSAALADRYRLERELGQGGMATVYLAHDLRHDRKVAIKVLRAELAAVIGADRFLSEIKTTANLQHPHILPLFDSGATGQQGGEERTYLFYVMPYVEGESLRDRLNRDKQLPINDAVRIAGEVAGALDYAHRRGVIHRDIKPENILLHDGRALVADFGIALAASKAGGTRMTETGMSLGTPHYMSPEQAMGEREIGPQSDVYALGAVTYEMLVGEPPFTGPTAQSIVAKVVTEVPRPMVPKRHTIPPHVESAVLTALEKLPADRFASTREFAEALTSPGYTRPVASAAFPVSRESRRWKWVAIGASVLALVSAGVAGLALSRPAPPRPVSRFSIAFPDSGAPNGGMALSPDGARLVYGGTTPDGQAMLWVKERNRAEASPIPGSEDPLGFTISPDGNWIALVQNEQLKKLPITGGVGIMLADSAFLSGIAWLEDGTLIYTSTSFTLTAISAGGGTPEKLWQPPGGRVPAMMTPLPGSRGVIVTSCTFACATSDLYVFDRRSGAARQLVTGVLQGWYLPTGHLAYVGRDQQMLVVPFDLGSLEIRGTPMPVLTDISLIVGIVPSMAMSSSGTLIVQVGPAEVGSALSDLVWLDRAGTRVSIDTSWTFRPSVQSGNVGWSISPDGKRLVIGLSSNSGEDIWIKQLPRGPLSRLTFDSGSLHRPRWTPDGRSVTYLRLSDGALLEQRADGTGTVRTLLPRGMVEGSWSRDGNWVIARTGGRAGQRGGRDIIGIRPGVDTVPRPLAANPNYDESAAALSPDGRWLAYQSDESGRSEVFIRPFPNTEGGKWQVSVNGGQSPLWAHSGRELFFVDGERRMVVTSVAVGASPDLGDRRILFPIGRDLYIGNPEFYTPFDISPDDQRFIMMRIRTPAASGQTTFVLVENWFEELKGPHDR